MKKKLPDKTRQILVLNGL